jgi:hypothetical protein
MTAVALGEQVTELQAKVAQLEATISEQAAELAELKRANLSLAAAKREKDKQRALDDLEYDDDDLRILRNGTGSQTHLRPSTLPFGGSVLLLAGSVELLVQRV